MKGIIINNILTCVPKKQRKYSITLQIKIEHVMTNTKYKHEKYCNVNKRTKMSTKI